MLGGIGGGRGLTVAAAPYLFRRMLPPPEALHKKEPLPPPLHAAWEPAVPSALPMPCPGEHEVRRQTRRCGGNRRKPPMLRMPLASGWLGTSGIMMAFQCKHVVELHRTLVAYKLCNWPPRKHGETAQLSKYSLKPGFKNSSHHWEGCSGHDGGTKNSMVLCRKCF